MFVGFPFQNPISVQHVASLPDCLILVDIPKLHVQTSGRIQWVTAMLCSIHLTGAAVQVNIGAQYV